MRAPHPANRFWCFMLPAALLVSLVSLLALHLAHFRDADVVGPRQSFHEERKVRPVSGVVELEREDDGSQHASLFAEIVVGEGVKS